MCCVDRLNPKLKGDRVRGRIWLEIRPYVPTGSFCLGMPDVPHEAAIPIRSIGPTIMAIVGNPDDRGDLYVSSVNFNKYAARSKLATVANVAITAKVMYSPVINVFCIRVRFFPTKYETIRYPDVTDK